MDMYLDDVLVREAYDRVTDAAEPLAQAVDLLIRELMITVHHELGAVAELDICGRDLATGLTLCRSPDLRRSLIAEIEDDLLTLQ